MKNSALYKFFILLYLIIAGLHSVSQISKFQPINGKRLLIIGQDLGAIGGFEAPNKDGYADHLPIVPAGATTYTSINSLGGLNHLINYGSGDVCAKCILENEIYDHSVLVIGLYMVGILNDINAGNYDSGIEFLANWIKEAQRPVFLRIGYEFNGSHNNYDPAAYKAAWIRIVNIFNQNNVNNYATVWQSNGYGSVNDLYGWYPGNTYVDWLGYSHFHGSGDGIIQIAKETGKPVMIAEATPRGADLMDGQGVKNWDDWFAPLFKHINDNPEIMALAYINVDWESQPMWEGQGWGDSRIQMDPYVTQKWLEEINNSNWMNSYPGLFNQLYGYTSTIENSFLQDEIQIRQYNQKIEIVINNHDVGNVSIRLCDLTGKMLYDSIYNKSSERFQKSFLIPVRLSGIYIMIITHKQKVKSSKIFIRH